MHEGNPSVSGGIKDLKLFKATQSGFEGKKKNKIKAATYKIVLFIMDKVLFEIASPPCRAPRTVPSAVKST